MPYVSAIFTVVPQGLVAAIDLFSDRAPRRFVTNTKALEGCHPFARACRVMGPDYMNEGRSDLRRQCLPRPLIQLIMERSSFPTFSIGCSASFLRIAKKLGRPAWFSRIHSRAQGPVWVSPRIFCISALTRSSMIRGPPL